MSLKGSTARKSVIGNVTAATLPPLLGTVTAEGPANMDFTSREEQQKLVRRDNADAVIDDATYVFANGAMTFDQALMALLIAELRDLNLILDSP